MKTRLLAIGLVLMLGMGLFAQTATAPSLGDGSFGSPYQIATLENLYWLSQSSSEWGKAYIQTADIDASSTSGWDSGAGWTPIGGYYPNPQFTGSYNGQGHTINGLYINRSSTEYQGLFGYISGAIIQNLGVTNENITGSSYVAGMVGFNYNYYGSSELSSCYSTGIVNGGWYVGGLVGYNLSSCIVSNSYSTASVSGTQYIGGLVGNNNSTTISGCYSTGSVSGSLFVGGLIGRNASTVSGCHSISSVNGTDWVGGLVGSNDNGNISKCFSTGSVSGSTAVGGLVGWNPSSTVINSYSTGSVSGYRYVGGLVGFNYTSSSVSNCYSAGNVSGSLSVGGLVGANSSTVGNSFWDTQISGQTNSEGGTAKTTAEMKTPSTFTSAGWDFTTVWGIFGDNYPILSPNPDYSLPVGLVSFSAETNGYSVNSSWFTESEVDNLGYILERSGEDGIWIQIASYQTDDALKCKGNTSSRTEYAFTDANVESGKEYFYRLSDVSTQGEITVYAPISIQMETLSDKTEMENAYPNPFNPWTFIAYRLAENSNVSITVFDMLGRSVKELFNGHQSAGSYHVYWSGTTESGMKAPSGNYIIRMRTENINQIQKVMFVK